MEYLYFLALPYGLQLLLIIHAIRTGRGSSWVWLLVIAPFIGAAAYFFIEIVPDLKHNRFLNSDKLRIMVNKNGRIKKLKALIEIAPTPANHIELGDEYVLLNAFDLAIGVYEGQLKGVYKDDPGLQMKLALAYFKISNFEKATYYFEILKNKKVDLFSSTEFYYLVSKYKSEPNKDEHLQEVIRHYESTWDYESAAYLAIIFEERGEPDKIPALATRLRQQTKRAKGRLKSTARRYHRKVSEILKKAMAK